MFQKKCFGIGKSHNLSKILPISLFGKGMTGTVLNGQESMGVRKLFSAAERKNAQRTRRHVLSHYSFTSSTLST